MVFPQVPCWLLTSSLVLSKCVRILRFTSKAQRVWISCCCKQRNCLEVRQRWEARWVATAAWCLFEAHPAHPHWTGQLSTPKPVSQDCSLSPLRNTLVLKDYRMHPKHRRHQDLLPCNKGISAQLEESLVSRSLTSLIRTVLPATECRGLWLKIVVVNIHLIHVKSKRNHNLHSYSPAVRRWQRRAVGKIEVQGNLDLSSDKERNLNFWNRR